MCKPPNSRVTRRDFIESALATGIVLQTHAMPLAEMKGSTSIFSQQYGGSRRVAQMFSLDQVMLLDGPFREAMERDRAYVLSLDADRFLHYFRSTAGLEPKAKAYEGWEEKVGRMLGHYLSACSMFARATGEVDFAQRQSYVVEELATCQRANGNGYVGGVEDAKRVFAEIGQGNIYFVDGRLNGVHAPWYMLHKMIAGLRDAYVYAGNPQALVVLAGFGDWAAQLTDKLNQADIQKMLMDEHGGMNEVFADLYAISGNSRYLTLSRRFNHTTVLGPLSHGEDDLNGLHANTQIPTVLGLYRQYEVTGDNASHKGGEFFWQNVTGRRSYANGGDSDKERFYPIGQMSQNLSAATAETCNSYNMVKLTDRLFAGTPREEMAAYSERVLWNHILASIDTSTPGMTYYLSLKPGHFKTFSKPYESFWCCVGTGMENHAKYGESIYFHFEDELWLNQFIASEVRWDAKQMRIVQTTGFPQEQQSIYTIRCQRPTEAVLSFRHPRWAGTGYKLQMNGKTSGVSHPGSYRRLKRTWRDGDIVRVSLPMQVSVEPMRDNPSLNAFFYGPILLAGVLGREGLPREVPYAGGDQLRFRDVADPAAPSLSRPDHGDVLLGASNSLSFLAHTDDRREITFRPLCTITQDRYSVYWRFA